MSADSPLLSVRELTVRRRDGVPVVRSVSFALAAGETLGIVGESGSGKSVTALALMGLLPAAFAPPEGTATLAGVTGNLLDPAVAAFVRGRRLAMVFQEPMSALNPVLTIGAQIEEVLQKHAPDGSEAMRRERVAALLAEVQLDPARVRSAFPHQLSGGQRQRAMIAMALAAEPQLLIADEPTTALDVTVQAEVLALLARLRERHGLAMLFISHDLAVVQTVADRVMVMERGEAVETGPSADVLRTPRHPYTQALLAAQPERLPAKLRAVQGEAKLEAQALSVHFPIRRGWLRRQVGEVRALKDVSFSLRAGEVLAVIGESGSGKTTLARTVLGLVRPTRGRFCAFGEDLTDADMRRWRSYRRRLQAVFQDPFASLNPKMTIATLLTEPMAVHGIGADDEERRARAASLLEEVGLSAQMLDRYPHAFSGGQRQRIAIAKALALEPEVLVCDEVTSALDVSVQAEILQLLAALVASRQLALLFITHNMGVVEYLADQVLVLYRGQVVENGDAASVLRAPQHPYTQQLLAAVPKLSA